MQALVRKTKSNYYMSTFSNERDSAATWRRLRHLGLIKQKTMQKNLVLSVEELNEYFAGVAEPLEGRVIGEGELDEQIDYSDRNFYWNYISVNDICQVLGGITTQAEGCDGVPLRLLRMAQPGICNILEHIYNYSFEQGVFPDAWKSALVLPVPKVRNPAVLQDYRPISILPVMSKIFEKIAVRQIQSYMEDNELHDEHQWVYKRRHSTQTCLLKVLEDVRKAVGERLVMITVCIDLSKAFDRVDHGRLCFKLRKLNFSRSVMKWMRSYMANRTQAVRDVRMNRISELARLCAVGVPQGSVLGPLLFAIYLMDLKEYIRWCKYSLYADDLIVYLYCSPAAVNEGIFKMNTDIEGLQIDGQN